MSIPRLSAPADAVIPSFRRLRLAPYWIVVAALLVGCATAGAGTTPCVAPPAPRIGIPSSQAECGIRDFHVNGVTRQPAKPETYRQNDIVRVVVTDANPFLFEYEIKANEQRVAEASIGDFFKFAFGITFPPKAGNTAVTGSSLIPTAGASAADGGTAVVCDATGAATYVARVEAAQAEEARIDGVFNHITQLASDADVALAAHRTVYLDPQREAPDVHGAAVASVGVHDQFTTTVEPLHDNLNRDVGEWSRTVATLSQESGAIVDALSCIGADDALVAVAEMVADTSTFGANLATVARKLTETHTERDRLAAVVNDKGRFYHTMLLQRFDVPTDVTVIVRRKGITGTDTFHDITSQRINVGGRARFSFSAGVGWTSVGTTTYGVTRRFVTPPAGSTDTVNAVVVAKENSDDQIFPMVTFNTRLTPSEWQVPANLHLVLGVGVSRADAKPLPGYLVGLGLDSFGQRLLVTGGVFFGEEHRLGGGLRPGDRVPGSLTEVPMQRRMIGKLGIGLTYRMF